MEGSGGSTSSCSQVLPLMAQEEDSLGRQPSIKLTFDQVLLLRLPRFMTSVTLHLVRREGDDEEIVGVLLVDLLQVSKDDSSSSDSSSDSSSSSSDEGSDESSDSDGSTSSGGSDSGKDCHISHSSLATPRVPVASVCGPPLQALQAQQPSSQPSSLPRRRSVLGGGLGATLDPATPTPTSLMFEYTGRHAAAEQQRGPGFFKGDRSTLDEEGEDEDITAAKGPPSLCLTCVVQALTADKLSRRASLNDPPPARASKGVGAGKGSSRRNSTLGEREPLTQRANSRKAYARSSAVQLPGICKFHVTAQTHCHVLSVPAIKVREIVRFYVGLLQQAPLGGLGAAAGGRAASSSSSGSGSGSGGQDAAALSSSERASLPSPRERYADLPTRVQRRVSFTLVEPTPATPEAKPTPAAVSVSAALPPLGLTLLDGANTCSSTLNTTSTNTAAGFSGRRGSHCSLTAVEEIAEHDWINGGSAVDSPSQSPSAQARRKSIILRMDADVTDVDDALRCDRFVHPSLLLPAPLLHPPYPSPPLRPIHSEVHNALGMTLLVKHLRSPRDCSAPNKRKP